MKYRVSIIVPNYNHALFLKKRLDSIFNQTFQDFEVILLDDASTDASKDILSTYKNHPKVSHLIFNAINSGSPFKQWEKGIKLAKGDFIWIAESDDYCELNFLEAMLNKCDANVGICYAQSIDVDENNTPLMHRLDYTRKFEPNIWEESFSRSGKMFVQNYLLVKNVIPNASAVVFNKHLVTPELFKKTLTEMKMCGDWFFWMRLLPKTSIAFVSKELNYFRNHAKVSRLHNSSTKKKQRLLEEGIIRKYTFLNYGILNEVETILMYKKWYSLHTKFAFLQTSFYKICFTNKVNFLYKFFMHKLF